MSSRKRERGKTEKPKYSEEDYTVAYFQALDIFKTARPNFKVLIQASRKVTSTRNVESFLFCRQMVKDTLIHGFLDLIGKRPKHIYDSSIEGPLDEGALGLVACYWELCPYASDGLFQVLESMSAVTTVEDLKLALSNPDIAKCIKDIASTREWPNGNYGGQMIVGAARTIMRRAVHNLSYDEGMDDPFVRTFDPEFVDFIRGFPGLPMDLSAAHYLAIHRGRDVSSLPRNPSKDHLCTTPLCMQIEYKNRFKRCSKCKKVFYCGRECQLKHWPVHKQICKQVVISK